MKTVGNMLGKLVSGSHWGLILGAGLGLVLAGCQEQKAQRQAPPPTVVSVAEVRPQTVPVTHQLVGQTAGSREVEVRAQVTGIMRRRTYVEGSIVKKGAQLFQIDPVTFQAAVDQARGQVAQQKAIHEQAKRDVARLKPLFAENAVSQKDLDDALSAQDKAKAALETATAALKQAEVNLGYTRVDAPISGATSKAVKSEGSLVTNGGDSLLTTISQIDPIYVYFSISDNDYLKTQQELKDKTLILPPNDQMEVELILADGSKFPRMGKLNFYDTRIDAQTGTIQARAVFANPNAELVPNQFVRVNLIGAVRPNVFLVPQKAVLQGQVGQFVYVVTPDNKVDTRPVEVGQWAGDNWIIKSGLAAGDRVILDNLLKLRPGVPVQIAPPAAAPAAAPAAGGRPAGREG